MKRYFSFEMYKAYMESEGETVSGWANECEGLEVVNGSIDGLPYMICDEWTIEKE